MLSNATRRLGDGQRVILRQRVRGSVRAVRAVRNTRVFLTETRVVADAEDGGPSTAEAEKKAQNDEPNEKEPEVQVAATQVTEGESSNAGTNEPPMKSW